MLRLSFRSSIKAAFLLVCVLLACDLRAEKLSREAVTAIAKNHFTCNGSQTKSKEAYDVQSDTIRQNSLVFTVFNNGERWVVVGNEDLFNPIICYGEGFFDIKSAREVQSPLYCLLQESLCNLDSISNGDPVRQERTVRRSSSDTHVYIAPLLDKRGINKWGQTGNNSSYCFAGKTYNMFCPRFDTSNLNDGPAGCTAVAMAQVMWYWRWPDHANIAENILPGGATYGPINTHYYDWENMPEEILNYTDLYKVNAVASLIRDCGYAGHMDYHTDYASMPLTNAKVALDNIFKYHVGHVVQYSSGANAFLEKIIDNLVNGRPVIMQATHYSDGSAHTFVVDGYDSDSSKVHLNLGWRNRSVGRNVWYDIDGLTGYHGYTIARRMLDELYPRCDERDGEFLDTDYTQVKKDSAGVEFRVTGADLCTTTSLNIASGGHFIMKSEEYIHIHPGFHAEAGSNVHIFIDEFPCNPTANFVVALPSTNDSDRFVEYVSGESNGAKAQTSSVDVSQEIMSTEQELQEDKDYVEKFFRSGSLYIRKAGHIYNATGLLIE